MNIYHRTRESIRSVAVLVFEKLLRRLDNTSPDALRCKYCKRASVKRKLCLHHLNLHRKACRDNYRKKVGIPLDAPLYKRPKRVKSLQSKSAKGQNKSGLYLPI